MSYIPDTGRVKTIEVDVGYGVSNRNAVNIVVVDSEIAAGSTVLAVQSGEAASGKSADEAEFDQFVVSSRVAEAGGSMTLIIRPLENVTLSGKYKINYVIG